jgi:selenophosphate synthase
MGFGLLKELLNRPDVAAAIKKVSTSEPVVVDVIAKKKTLTRGTGVTYSNIKTSPDGLLNQTEVQKKTLLGG